ncbi:MAG: VOC family protein [Novosphingobium sp.]|nr:VOC family protein [Novosphingobium sp.]
MRSTIHHMGITVKDLDESIAFYSAAFGLEIVDRALFSGEELAYVVQVPGAELEYAFMAGQNAVLELIEYKAPKGKPYTLRNNDVGAAHCCFVVDDLEETYEKLLAMGVEFNAPPQTAPDIAPFNELKYTYFRDLNGITIELFQPSDGPLSLPQLLAAARAAGAREPTS